MASDPKAEAALALHRFGLGPRAGSIAAIASDPRGALLAELDRPGAARIADAEPAVERGGRPRRIRVSAEAARRAPGRQRTAQQAATERRWRTRQAEPQMSEPSGTPAAPAPQARRSPRRR